MSARDLLLQVKALPPAEQRRFMDAMIDFNADIHATPVRLRAPDFDSYWRRLHSLGMPAWTAEQTADLDRWLAGGADTFWSFDLKARDLAVLEGLRIPALA